MKKNILSRLCKHLMTTKAKARRIFPANTLTAIEQVIAAGERQHRAEVRVIVEPSLEWSDIASRLTPRQRAIELFALHRIWDTEENCGVLLYINLADHKVEIVTDRAISRLIGKQEWHAVCQTITHGFAQRHYHDSVVAALAQMNTLLAQHFPDKGTGPNQLSNAPVFL